MNKFLRGFLLIASLYLSLEMLTLSVMASPYLLGPQDRLNIRVYDLRKNAGEAYPWAALNGEFSVGADGNVSMPIIGEIAAAGNTSADLAKIIGSNLKTKADLAETPAASVEVIKYRPFYILGAVQQPGKYEFEPGLTVIQAISIAQGLVRPEDANALDREILNSDGEIRTLQIDQISLKAKLARFEAEVAESEKLQFPADAKETEDTRKSLIALRQEAVLFEARRNSLKSEVESLNRSKDFLQKELSSLNSKLETLGRQLDINRRELSQVSEMVTRGLSILPRQLAAEQNQATFESNRLDVQVAILRAQQSLSRTERDIIEVHSKYRKEALEGVAETRHKIAQNIEKIRTAQQLSVNAKARLITSIDSEDKVAVNYERTRKIGQAYEKIIVPETSEVEPGDVIKVILKLRESRSPTY